MATQTINEEKLGAFMNQLVSELGATVEAALVVTGDRLGLWKALAGTGRAIRSPVPVPPPRTTVSPRAIGSRSLAILSAFGSITPTAPRATGSSETACRQAVAVPNAPTRPDGSRSARRGCDGRAGAAGTSAADTP
jgi:hypothetical protein